MKWNVPPALRSIVSDDGQTLVIRKQRPPGLWAYFTGSRVSITITRDGVQVGDGARFLPTGLELIGVPARWLELRIDDQTLIRPFGAPWGPRSALWISQTIAERLGLRLKESWDEEAWEATAPLREQTWEVWHNNTADNRDDFPLHWEFEARPPEEEVSHEAMILRIPNGSVLIVRGNLWVGERKAPLDRVVAARPLFREDAGILEVFFDTGQILRLRVFVDEDPRVASARVRGLGEAIERLAERVRAEEAGSAADVPDAMAGLVKPKR